VTRSLLFSIFRGRRGFTFFEVMVSLLIGTVVIGGVMGALSASLQYTKRLQEKALVQPVLEAVAQDIIANPQSVEMGAVAARGFPGEPSVEISVTEAEEDGGLLNRQTDNLRRIQLRFRGEILEFSLIVPPEL